MERWTATLVEGLVSLAETVGSSGRILIGVDDIIGTASKRLCMQWQKDSRAVELGLWMQINTFGEDTGICHRSSNYLEMFYMYGKSLTSWKVDCYVIYRTLS